MLCVDYITGGLCGQCCSFCSLCSYPKMSVFIRSFIGVHYNNPILSMKQ